MFTAELAAKIKVRDDEILRLHDMFQPGQNLEKLNMKFQQEQSELAVSKLESQVDFLNKENINLDRQVQLLKGDQNGQMAMAQYQAMKKDMDELLFENQRMHTDLQAGAQ